ncbi:DUF5683 domain-containing protein [Neolewinella agarilytica]|nr:DUF5683 domain-containing protein [Neolewinella agarilytica]
MTSLFPLEGCCSGAAGRRAVGVLTALAFVILCLAPAAAPAQSDSKNPNRGVRKMTDSIPDATILSDTIVALSAIQRGPKKALLWSIIPGGGQVYNKRWWKVPIVYGGLLGMVAYADFNQTRYTRFTTALENRCLGEGNVVIFPNEDCIATVDDFPVDQVSNAALLQARANADRARQTAYIGIFIAYVMQAVEAYTDAHLQEFDISDDLSFRLGPVANPEGLMSYGLTVPLGSGRKKRNEEARVKALVR